MLNILYILYRRSDKKKCKTFPISDIVSTLDDFWYVHIIRNVIGCIKLECFDWIPSLKDSQPDGIL